MDLRLVTNEEVCSFLASCIRNARSQKGYSQLVMSKKSGIPLRTYKRIELTGDGSIFNLIIILRTLDRIRGIEILFPLPLTEPRFTNIDRVLAVREVVSKK